MLSTGAEVVSQPDQLVVPAYKEDTEQFQSTVMLVTGRAATNQLGHLNSLIFHSFPITQFDEKKKKIFTFQS